jgi:hypothetical protein
MPALICTPSDERLYRFERALQRRYAFLRTPLDEMSANLLAQRIWRENCHPQETKPHPKVIICLHFPQSSVFEQAFGASRPAAFYRRKSHEIYAHSNGNGHILADILVHELTHALRSILCEKERHGDLLVQHYFLLIEKYLATPCCIAAGVAVLPGKFSQYLMSLYLQGERDASY